MLLGHGRYVNCYRSLIHLNQVAQFSGYMQRMVLSCQECGVAEWLLLELYVQPCVTLVAKVCQQVKVL